MTAPREPRERRPGLFSALRYRDFRLYWIGLVAQVSGQQMTTVTLGWLAYDLTGAPLALGVISLAQAVPQIGFNLLGGALADRIDQRKLITWAQLSNAALLVVTATLTVAGHITLWQLVVLSFFVGVARSIDEPARQALFPNLLPDRSLISTAVPVVAMAWQVNRIMSPAIAGFVIAAAGAGEAFFLAAAGAGVMVAMLRLIRVQRVEARARGNVLANIVEGARFTWSTPVFRIVIGTALLNAVLAVSYAFVLPVFAAEHDAGSTGLGVMFSVTGAGAILSLSFVAWAVRVFPVGRVVVFSICAFLGAIIGFALAPRFWIALVMLAAVGFFQHLFLASAQIILQSLVPDELRGRVMGLYGMLWSMTPLGGALLNSVAQLVGAPAALAGSGSLMLLFVLLVVAPSRALRDVVLPSEPPRRAGE